MREFLILHRGTNEQKECADITIARVYNIDTAISTMRTIIQNRREFTKLGLDMMLYPSEGGEIVMLTPSGAEIRESDV